MSRRLVIVSNRLPINIKKTGDKFEYSRSVGGLATGMSPLFKQYNSLWIGWPGMTVDSKKDKSAIKTMLKSDNMLPIFMTQEEMEGYYEGFSNKTIWPLCHYFSENTIYNPHFWDIYKRINQRFCDVLTDIYQPDDIFWINDYHLLLLPGLVKEKMPESLLGFFLHIPFPSFEIFRTLPWRTEILKGMLGADVIGFHTYDYVRHFLSSATRLLRVEQSLTRITYNERVIKADCFPMGIDYEKYSQAMERKSVQKEMKNFKENLSCCHLIISIDRLDYSKGILQRLAGFDLFLQNNPEYKGKITLLLVVVPSRSRVKAYQQLKYQVDEMVGRINGRYGTIGWTPIWYLYRSLSFEPLSAVYNIADIALITPFRDGMNLIAKEFVASKMTGRGVLILSEMAGSADELGEALIINPNNIEDIARAIKEGLEMPEEEKIRRMREMQNILKRYNIKRWAEDFFHSLLEIKDLRKTMLGKSVTKSVSQQILKDFKNKTDKIIFLDYDGTLVPYAATPEQANPDPELLELLKKLSKVGNCDLVINSGRKKETIDEWFGHMDIHLCAEHGAWLRPIKSSWQTIEPLEQSWKQEVRPLLELYVERTPGSFIETKNYSLVWHYRKADVGLGEIRARELLRSLVYLTANLNLQVLEGNKVIEIKNAIIDKGRAARYIMDDKQFDFILSFGDDWTDEYLFRALPDSAYKIKVGYQTSAAGYTMKSYKNVRELLRMLLGYK